MNVQPGIRFWNGLCIAALAAIAGLLIFNLAAPQPSAQQRKLARIRGDNKLREQTETATHQFEARRQVIDSRVWAKSADAVGAETLAKATEMTKSHGLNLSAFRPQKPADEGELIRLDYVMTLEGPFPGLQAMVRQLETSDYRLAVHRVQVASADEASDLVNATIGVSAFVEKPKVKTSTQS